jgi:hypothetical protein
VLWLDRLPLQQRLLRERRLLPGHGLLRLQVPLRDQRRHL